MQSGKCSTALGLWISIGLLLATCSLPGYAFALTATAIGSPTPTQILGSPGTTVTNGDFQITGTGTGGVTVGSGINETTTWVFDFAGDLDFTTFFPAVLRSAPLVVTLTPRGGFPTDEIHIDGLPPIRQGNFAPEFSLGVTTTYQLDLLNFYSGSEILAALSAGTAGHIPIVYQDDAIVSFAHLDLVPSRMELLDQDKSDFSPTSIQVISMRGPIGQEFTPQLTELNIVELFIQAFTFDDRGSALQVSIREETIDGPIIGSSVITFLEPVFRGVTPFEFLEPVRLQPGRLYVLEVIVVFGDAAVADNLQCFGSSSCEFDYPGGSSIVEGEPRDGVDLWFREGLARAPVRTPPTVACPCDGNSLANPNAAWNDSFSTVKCELFRAANILSGFTLFNRVPITLSVVGPGIPDAAPTVCAIVSDQDRLLTVELTRPEGNACRLSLFQIAANDGVTCR